MESEDTYELLNQYQPLDLESQRVAAIEQAECERRNFNAFGSSQPSSEPRKRKHHVVGDGDEDDDEDDDDDEEKTSNQKKKTVIGKCNTSDQKKKKEKVIDVESDYDDDDEEEEKSSDHKKNTVKGKGKASVQKKKNKKVLDVEDDDQKTPRQWSSVWTDFKVITKKNRLGETEQKAVCIRCKKEYKHDSHNNGTSCLLRHREKCNPKSRNGDVGNMLVTAEGKLQARKIDHGVFREMVSMTIIKHDLPYSYVEYEGVRGVWKYLNADVKFISRNTAVKDVYKFYENGIHRLKRELAHLPGRISFTSDLWTAKTQESYLCLTAHYVDLDWKLNTKILSFSALPPPHTGMDLAMHILELWSQWGIEKKVFSITLDNASSNDSSQEILKSQLVVRDALLCGGEFFHVRCAAHILNLIVQDGLKVIGDSLRKVRDNIKYVGASQSREILFAKCVATVGIHLKAGLILDVPTRWNSTYKMLDRAIKYRAAFDNMKTIDGRNFKSNPTEAEWNRLKEMSDFLEPFDEITRLMSGSTYPTSNLYFMQVWRIQNWLTENENSRDDIIKKMVIPMKEKFDKYWEEVSDIFAIASVFDPRLKFKLAEFAFRKLDRSSFQEKMEYLRGKLRALFEIYKNKTKSSSTPKNTRENEQDRVDVEEPKGNLSNYKDFFAFCKATVIVSGKSSLELYLEEPPIYDGTCGSLDILKFWQENSERYGALASMASDILSIPITTVASESTFSIGARVLSKYRSRLLPKNVQALICSRNWIQGFEAYENEEEEEVTGEDDAPPTVQSIDVDEE